jgi:hypothetical protein
MDFFGGKKISGFELPFLRNAQKTPEKKSIKNKNKNKNKNRASNYFFFSAAANVRHFRHFVFHAAPWCVCVWCGWVGGWGMGAGRSSFKGA